MFKWLFGKKEQDHQVNCAMCDINLTVTLATDLQPSSYDHGLQKFTELDCPFCKTSLAIIRDSGGKFSAADIKWDIVSAEYDAQESSLSDKIAELQDIIDVEDSTQEEISQAKKALTPLQAKYDKLEAGYEKKEETYSDRQSRWNDKVIDKFDQ